MASECVLKYLSVMYCLIMILYLSTTHSGAYLILDDKKGFSLASPNKRTIHSGRLTARRLARSLCKSLDGKREFYDALSDHLCEVSSEMRVDFVKFLCKRKNKILEKWVSEVYDKDGNGVISHHERSYYKQHIND